MNKDNLVIFKGNVDGITVVLDQQAPFEEIIESFTHKLVTSKNFFKGAKASLRFKGRALSKEQQQVLMKVLTNQDIIDISFVYEFEQTTCSKKEEYMEWVKSELEDVNVSLTYVHNGPVRSGQHVHYNGSIIVLGDVNPGGVVSASFNIIIMGTLKGKAHAGMDQVAVKPFVVALNMQPTHIGIKSYIAQPPDKDLHEEQRKCNPQIAYICKEQIYVDEIDFKTLNHMLQ